MIDDRQLLRTSRNLVAALAALMGVWFIVDGIGSMGSALGFFGGLPTLGTLSVWSLQCVLPVIVGIALILCRDWLARKLIKPVRADTCPGCDYPIDNGAAKCPECGIGLAAPASTDK